jgi:hypothetical protein
MRNTDEHLDGCIRIATRLIKPDRPTEIRITVVKAASSIKIMADFVKEK